jgi:hypothetical protein
MKKTPETIKRTTMKNPTKKTEAKYKGIIVLQKDRPIQEMICEAANTYLKELVMNYRDSFTADGDSLVITKSGTLTLHGKFYEMCRRSIDLDGTLKTLRKAQSFMTMALSDLSQIETMYAVIRETNDAKLKKMEQLSLVMRPGQAWRKKLDAVGLGKNADKWLKYWDKTYPEIRNLKKESAGRHKLEIILPAG